MGFLMLFFMFCVWRNTRTIKKLLYHIAVDTGYPKTFGQKFSDLLMETVSIRKQKKRERKERLKVQSNEPETDAQPEKIDN